MISNCSKCGTVIEDIKTVIIDIGKPVPDDIDSKTWAVMMALRTYAHPCGHVIENFGDVEIFPNDVKAWEFYNKTKKTISE